MPLEVDGLSKKLVPLSPDPFKVDGSDTHGSEAAVAGVIQQGLVRICRSDGDATAWMTLRISSIGGTGAVIGPTEECLCVLHVTSAESRQLWDLNKPLPSNDFSNAFHVQCKQGGVREVVRAASERQQEGGLAAT